MIRPLLILLFLCSPAYADTLTGRVHVIDGDTIAFPSPTDDGRVRLLDIDAPEIRQNCGEWYWWSACGWKAYVALRALLKDEEVRCDLTERDRYGRWLARCSIWEGLDLSVWMAKEGLAIPYRNCKCPDVRAAAEEARQASRGMWSTGFIEPWRWRKGER